MFIRLFSLVMLLTMNCQNLLFAAAQEEKESPEWVLSYFLVLLCLGLALLIILRPSKRTESTFTQEELNAQRAESVKKMTGGH
ncbi:MAG: hypothetical protein ACRCUY_10910 [Thermoguttaceae bacterium]